MLKRLHDGVAGFNIPAFVERVCIATFAQKFASVAGFNIPAFVERCRPTTRSTSRPPSVAGFNIPAFVERSNSAMLVNHAAECRRV